MLTSHSVNPHVHPVLWTIQFSGWESAKLGVGDLKRPRNIIN